MSKLDIEKHTRLMKQFFFSGSVSTTFVHDCVHGYILHMFSFPSIITFPSTQRYLALLFSKL